MSVSSLVVHLLLWEVENLFYIGVHNVAIVAIAVCEDTLGTFIAYGSERQTVYASSDLRFDELFQI